MHWMNHTALRESSPRRRDAGLSLGDLPVEGRLLLACARARLSAEDAVRIQALVAAPPDWELLLALARRHRVVALLYQALRAVPGIPAAVLAQLRAEAQRHAGHSLRQVGELAQLAQAFAAEGVPLIVLKGPALARLAYGNVALRSSVDLDLLVPRRDLPRASALLERHGYTRLEQLGAGQTEAYLAAQHHFSFVRDDLLVELHYELRERYFSYRSDLAGLWARAAPVVLGGCTLQAPGYADQFTTLCLHGLRHCWERLAWICDIAALLGQQRDLDWPALLAQLRSYGAERVLLLGVYLAHTLLDAPAPDSVVARAARDPAVPTLAGEVLETLCASPPQERSLLASARFHLRARERRRDRLRSCLLLACSPTLGDWALGPLPRQLSFLYYLIRPLRLAVTYGARADATSARGGVLWRLRRRR